MSTAQDVLTQARWQLRDVITGNYDFSDTELLAYISDAQKDVFKKRPESVVTDDEIVTATFSVTAITATSDVLEVADNYIDCLIDYVVATALSKHAINIGLGDGIAQARWNKYENGIRN